MSNVIIKRDISPIYLSPESQWRFFLGHFSIHITIPEIEEEKSTLNPNIPPWIICANKSSGWLNMTIFKRNPNIGPPPTWCINQSRLLLQDGFYINLSINSRGLHAHYLLASIEGWRMSVPNLANWPNDVLKHIQSQLCYISTLSFFCSKASSNFVAEWN